MDNYKYRNYMVLFGKTVKNSNVIKISSIIGIAIIWRIIVGENFYEGPKNPYIFPVLAFCFISILLGELTRKIIRVFKKEKINDQVISKNDKSDIIENKRDDDTLNCSIVWALIFLLLSLF